MDLLCYSDSDETEASETAEAVSASPQPSNSQPAQSVNGKGKLRLLSAADLFATERNTIRITKDDKEVEIIPTISTEAAKPRQPAVIEKKAVSAMAVLDPSCSTAPSKAPPRSGLAVKQSKAPQRESVGTASKKRDGDTVTAKDKVKRQRLSGQSGIGSDFREWRSEEEMRQRQQFD